MTRHQNKLRSQLDAHDVASAKIHGNVKGKQEQLKEKLDAQIQQQQQVQGHRRHGQGRAQQHSGSGDAEESQSESDGDADTDSDDADDLRSAAGPPLRSSTFKQPPVAESQPTSKVFNQVRQWPRKSCLLVVTWRRCGNP